MTRSLAAIEADLRRATIAIRLADERCDCARLVRLRQQQDKWLDEWVRASRATR